MDLLEKANQERLKIRQNAEKRERKIQKMKEELHGALKDVFAELHDGGASTHGHSIGPNVASITLYGETITILITELHNAIEENPEIILEDFIKLRILNEYKEKIGLEAQ